MPFHHDGKTNDNGAFLSIPDCTEEQERKAVETVLRECRGEEDGRLLLSVLGLTGTAEGMLAGGAQQP